MAKKRKRSRKSRQSGSGLLPLAALAAGAYFLLKRNAGAAPAELAPGPIRAAAPGAARAD